MKPMSLPCVRKLSFAAKIIAILVYCDGFYDVLEGLDRLILPSESLPITASLDQPSSLTSRFSAPFQRESTLCRRSSRLSTRGPNLRRYPLTDSGHELPQERTQSVPSAASYARSHTDHSSVAHDSKSMGIS